jgi:hypothetical protein
MLRLLEIDDEFCFFVPHCLRRHPHFAQQPATPRAAQFASVFFRLE